MPEKEKDNKDILILIEFLKERSPFTADNSLMNIETGTFGSFHQKQCPSVVCLASKSGHFQPLQMLPNITLCAFIFSISIG